MNITDPSLTPEKLYLFNQGTYYHSYRLFGAHLVEGGVRFTVWCPDVTSVDVAGDFSGWEPWPLAPQGSTGVWSAVVAIVIPVAVLAVGFVIWFRRRRK